MNSSNSESSTGERVEAEALGGAAVHARHSGLVDYVANDDADALDIVRRLVTRLRPSTAPPLLVGLGFDVQRCAQLERGVHDVPLDAVVTESGIQFFNKER